MMKNKNIECRESNIELLRIVSMCMIILHHFSLYTGLWNQNEISLKSICGTGMFILGKIGVNIFIIISGYFLINAKFKYKRLLKLWFQIFFYSVVIFTITKVFNLEKVSLNEGIKYFFPISYSTYWFASTYFLLSLLSPFINIFIKRIDKDTYKKLLIILFVIFSLIYNVLYGSNSFGYGVETFCSLQWFIYIYLLGGYIKINGIQFLNKKRNASITLAFMCLMLLLLAIFSKLIGNMDIIYYYTRMNSIFMLIPAVAIFYVFKELKIKNSKIINKIAKVTFAVYLIHEHNYIKNSWKNINPNLSLIQIITFSIFIIITLFLIALISEAIRICIEKFIIKLIRKIKKLNNIDNKIKNMLNLD